MFFKKLEIFGFKSFADKTTLTFQPGITAVVGPNGCGKSNVFDSIRWVLGEQSVKELRGSSMGDVIFNGTEKKPSLGFAEVSLTFSNEQRSLPIAYDEVTITRRLFRSGESEYLINKTAVRLKDIQEMLMGTGIGSEAYSLVQQGKVDLVVSAKPEDRRQIFDEASGITKYKAKKKEAMNKLKDTENNLLRINDIVTEVKRQIASIERQATKARKYKVEFEKLKTLELRLARHQKDHFYQEQQGIRNVTQEIKDREAELRRELDEISNLLTNEINYVEDLDQQINEVKTEEIRLQGQIDLNNRQIGFNQERLDGLRENNVKFAERKDQLKERCRTQQEEIERLKDGLISMAEALEQNEILTRERKQTLSSLDGSILEARSQIQGHEDKIVEMTARQTRTRTDLTESLKEIQGGLARQRRLEHEMEKVLQEKADFEQKKQHVNFQLVTLKGVIGEMIDRQTQNKQILKEMQEALDRVRKDIDEHEKKKMFFISQKDFIEKLHAQYQDIPDPVIEGRLITHEPPHEHHTGILGKVKEVKILGEEKSSGIFRPFQGGASRQMYEITCETKFIELNPIQISHKIEEIAAEITERRAIEAEVLEKLDRQEQRLEDLLKEIHEKEKQFSILESQRQDLTREVTKVEDELNVLVSEKEEVSSSVSTHQKREEEWNFQLESLTKEIEWAQNDIKEKREWINHKSQEKEDLSVQIAQLETEVTSHRDKIQSQEKTQRMFEEALDGWLEEINKIDGELAGQDEKRDQYLQEINQLTEAIEGTKREAENLQANLQEFLQQKEEVAQRINSFRASMTGTEEELDRMEKEVHLKEMQLQQLSFNETSLRERLVQAYRLNLDELSQVSDGEGDSYEPLDPDAAQEEIQALRKRCDSFGNVNLSAMEEYEELKERFEFLTKQQSDLLEAKSHLMSTVAKINKSTRQMFMDTFTRVSEEFRIYFRMLFGGGEANLILMDPDNVLESGIDIVARPPGKKLQNISLLSGGEKTLTAIAMIFGVFKVNPSPFCVLDEIDAALDESNVGRFAALLKEFAQIAQFIVITHNKKTISSANVLYGVTMPETGMSRIVSVELKDREPGEVKEALTVGAAA